MIMYVLRSSFDTNLSCSPKSLSLRHCSKGRHGYCFFYVIRKTCPCNVYPLEPHFYVVKLGFAGVYLFFLFLLQNIDCGYSLEPPRRGGSNVYPQSMF